MMKQEYKLEIASQLIYLKNDSDNVCSAIGTTLNKTPALYRYTEIIPKMFLISTVAQRCSHEDVFAKEPIRRFAMAMTTNEAFSEAERINLLHFPKFNLNGITIHRNVLIIFLPEHHSKQNDKKQYSNSLKALVFG